MFKAIKNMVGMIDGKKFLAKNPMNYLEQNRDYNGWYVTTNQNTVILWDIYSKIINIGLNLPSNFHDSKSTLWCNIYNHIAKLPEGYVVVCDSAFTITSELIGKLLKLKEVDDSDERITKTEFEKSLIHLQQCSEWGNNVLKGSFRRLKVPLLCHNSVVLYPSP